jgi:mono/diheme cytochrome c family protein
MKTPRFFLVPLLAAGLGLSACSDEGDPAKPGDPGDPDPVSFASDVQPIFDANCIVCHGAGGNGGLDLRSPQSYDNLVDLTSPNYSAKRVAPGDPDNSVLVDKISGAGQFGSRMPPSGPGLSSGQIQTIRTWVVEGAERN